MREAWQGGSPTQLGAVLRLDVQGAPTAAARALAGRVLRLRPKPRFVKDHTEQNPLSDTTKVARHRVDTPSY